MLIRNYKNCVKLASTAFDGNTGMIHNMLTILCAGLMRPCWLETLGAEFSPGSVNEQ